MTTGVKESTLTFLFLFFCAPVSTQEPRFADLFFGPSNHGDKARGCCVVRAGEISGRGVTVRQVIEAAYRRHTFDRREVIGGPAWIDEDRFDFTAQVAGGHVYDRSGFPSATFATLRAYANQHARIRTELRERPVYALVSTGGARPGLVSSVADCAAQMRAFERKEPISGRPCGASPYPGRIMATGITMADLASLITPWLDLTVIDRSGLDGAFDVDLEGVEVKPAGPFGTSYRPSDATRSIFEHIERQLGMRLERVSAQVEVVVVDSVEKPSQGQAWRDPSPHQVRRVTVDSSVQLEVLEWGGSGPPVVLLACYLSTHMYDEFAPKLTNQFRVYGITRRGIGASDKPADGYAVLRSANDVLEVVNALKLRKSILVGHSCAGQILTMFAAQHSDRLLGLVYLDGASDPTMTPADVGASMPDSAMLPGPITPSTPPDNSSFEAFRVSQKRARGWAFPEGELRQQFAANPDGSVGRSTLSPVIRRAITTDARVKPDYSRIRVPVLAIYVRDLPFEEVAARFAIKDERQRAALRQEHAATRALYARWQQDLLAGVPTARIVELPGASLYMFLSNEADVIRELRAFAAAAFTGDKEN